MGRTTNGGYGRLNIGGKIVGAHRFAYELSVGPIPDGMTIDHRCNNLICCNPSHMLVATQRENILRSSNPLAEQSRQTECRRGHPLSGDNLMIGRDGHRRCRECMRLARLRWKAKQKTLT